MTKQYAPVFAPLPHTMARGSEARRFLRLCKPFLFPKCPETNPRKLSRCFPWSALVSFCAGPRPFAQLCLLCEKVLERANPPGASILVAGPSYLSVLKQQPSLGDRACSTSILLSGDREYSNSTQVLGTERVQPASCFWGPS